MVNVFKRDMCRRRHKVRFSNLRNESFSLCKHSDADMKYYYIQPQSSHDVLLPHYSCLNLYCKNLGISIPSRISPKNSWLIMIFPQFLIQSFFVLVHSTFGRIWHTFNVFNNINDSIKYRIIVRNVFVTINLDVGSNDSTSNVVFTGTINHLIAIITKHAE